MTTTTALPTDVNAILATNEWQPRWAGHPTMTDPYGNTVTITDDGETLRIEFEYALPGMIETLHLDPNHGATRIAAVITALAQPEAE